MDEPQLTPFLKRLASTEREKAVESLRLFLSQSRTFTEIDFLKLWKGLYYCMWMCDRMHVQQQLADTLAELVSVLQPQNTTLFLQAFWMTLAKQWPKLDQHRLDKFYLLARRYVAAGFRFLQSRDWSDESIIEYTEMLSTGPLHPKNQKVPNSIRYHITDIYLDELDKLEPLESADQSFARKATQLTAPFVALRKDGLDKIAKVKAKALLEDPRLQVLEEL